MADICDDNRFEIIAKAKKALLEGTNIDMCADEMAVIDNILFRCWQMGWLDRYDRCEPQTEYDKYREKIRPHDPHKDWLEDEPQTDVIIGTPSHEFKLKNGQTGNEPIVTIAKTEPQTDCAWKIAQTVFDSTVTLYEAEDVAKRIDKDINVPNKSEVTYGR